MTKKIIVLFISALMILSLAGCKKKKGQDDSGGNNPGGGSNNNINDIIKDPEYNPSDPTQYIYKSVFENSPYKEQWKTSRRGAYIYNIWDSSVLPDVFPSKPDSVTSVDRTSFVGLLDEKIEYRAPGELYIEVDYDTDAKPWTYYYVMFEGNESTYNDIISDISQKFEYENERESGWDDRLIGDLYAYSKEWYLYLRYSQNINWGDSGYVTTDEFSFTLYAMPVHHTLPKQVEGLLLPQFGYLLNGVFDLIGYESGDDDYTYTSYNFETGTANGSLKSNWSTSEINYYGGTKEDAESYGEYLISQGYEKTYDSRTYNEDSYYLTYKKGEMTVDVQYNSDGKKVSIWVTFGDTSMFYY